MRTKLFLLFICFFGLMGCLPAREPVSVTRPVLAIATRPTEVTTAVPPTATPPPTHTPESTLATTATAVPPTATPLPTNTPEPAWPTTPILFVRDGALQRWLPQTNEVEVLVERVDTDPIYASNIAVFMREIVPQETYALIVFHFPSQTEIILDQIPAGESVTVRVSPEGQWVGLITRSSDSEYLTLTLTLHQLLFLGSTVSTGSTRTIPTNIQKDVYIFLASFSWKNENQLTWSSRTGIWGLDLTDDSPEALLLIEPSRNTYEHPGSVDANGNYLPVSTTFRPYSWSPDGRYLIAREDAYEGGTFRVIEHETNRSMAIPDANYGVYSDALIWVNNDSFLHFNGKITHWQVQAEDQFALIEISSFQFEHGLFDNLGQISGNHIRFSYSLLSGPAKSWIYDLNFETGEFTKLSLDLQSREIVVYWTPNNREILWQLSGLSGPSTSIFYDSLDGQATVNLDEVFGTNSCCWYWERAGSE